MSDNIGRVFATNLMPQINSELRIKINLILHQFFTITQVTIEKRQVFLQDVYSSR